MPIYAYRCDACGHAVDVLRKVSDPPLSICPACGAETFRKQVTAAGFQLKGSGWYVTDFKGGPQSSNTGVRAEGKAEGKTEGKAEAKPGAKTAGEAGKSVDASAPAGPKASAPAPGASAPAAAPAPASPPATGGSSGAAK